MSDVESDWRSSGEGSSNEQSSKTDHGDADSDVEGHAAKRDADVDIVSDDAVSVADSEAASLCSLDPDFLVTLPPELESAAQLRVRDVCARYEEAVIRPNAARAAAERAELVSRGQLSADVAAHDDELALMGLDPEEVRDTSMVAEYSREIFAYMDRCERETMANPNYMSFQGEIEWHMRATLVDWLLQVHMRYHMLPETLWIAINIVDRFLSVRVVSLAKLQLVGVTAMFVAAKYEEILAPSVDEFVYMTESGYSRDEILKGERIILSTLDFNISSYCSPYSWVRRISKADDYDIQTRTLSKFLMEVTLLDSRFLRAKPSLIAAVGMFLSKKMLNGQWDDAFVYYSGFTEEQLVPGANLLLEKLLDDGFAEHFVCRKYANKKFLKASIFARDWAQRNHSALIAAAEAAAEQGSQQ
ncbi:A/B/D/E cyclin [Tilletiopsis washingtonensis]|uniref:A/B/D/E cyclin n=1 Tax=Tilletiopsis washingtonensis TaxID=58919 RepID=A0A316ZFM4_9BASI|nr:A/B/D/E cyclin [Tilletiopsis washingtonensis]PWO00558.1 A/B/D/E cyclin [Tilletiopsis washingtonensis]